MKRIKSETGFTIIELLISTVIFSMVLLVITGAIIQFGRLYYKGVIGAQTQAVTRNVISSISQDIQFGGSAALIDQIDPKTNIPGIQKAQIGNRCYVFQFNQQVSAANPHALAYSDGTCGAAMWPDTAHGTEMLGTNMQLVALSVKEQGSSGLYKILVRVAYGSANDMAGGSGGPRTQCNTIVLGGQFCYVSQLETTVAKRVK